MTSMSRVGANLATLANALLGLGAILYVLAGNAIWAMLLVVCGIGFDGLDGMLARRAGGPPSPVGRVLDSVADAVTFGLAPAFLVAVHTEHAALWAPYRGYALLAAVLVGSLALARLVYFTARGWRHPDFVGASTPQNALAVVVLLLFLDRPAFLGTNPPAALSLVAALAVLMVLPIPYPKIRRGGTLRPVMTVVAVALAAALVPLQFVPAPGSAVYLLAEACAAVGAAGLATFYVLGPWTVRPPAPVPAGPGGAHDP